jgi:hypothetical protein
MLYDSLTESGMTAEFPKTWGPVHECGRKEEQSSSNGIAVESAHVKRYWRGKAYTHGCSAIFLLPWGPLRYFPTILLLSRGEQQGAAQGGGVAVEHYGGHAGKSRRDLRFEQKSSVAKSRRALGTT